MPIRPRVHQLLEGQDHALATATRCFLVTLILANVLAVVLDSVHEIHVDYGAALLAFEAFSLFVFGLEYLLRLWTCVEDARYHGRLGRLRWTASPGALVDLAAILPAFFMTDIRLVRVLRIARLVRVAKLGRYALALRTLRHVMLARLPDLISLSFVLMILLVLSSAMMYHLEHDAQPDAFSSIPATMWWGIVTLTTIGYGDMAPITVGGRLLGSIVAILGIGMFALPAGLLGATFVEELQKARRLGREQRVTEGHHPDAPHCPHCGEPLPSS